MEAGNTNTQEFFLQAHEEMKEDLDECRDNCDTFLSHFE
jgi:hypothetical protein